MELKQEWRTACFGSVRTIPGNKRDSTAGRTLVKWSRDVNDFKVTAAMRHGTSNRRSRNNRGGGGGHRQGTPNRAQVFDSNGPDVRIRGTAYQIVEKYLALAKDASSSGDLVMAESYLQHAEHYQRVINEWGYPPNQQPRVEQGQQSDSYDRSMERPATPSTIPGEGPQPGNSVKDDLGLPTSILGTKRDIKADDLADA